MRSTKRFDPGPETALGHPVLSNFYLEWQATRSQKKSPLFHQARFLIFKTKTKPVLASGPEHPYEVQERSRVRNRDAEGCSNNTAAMKSEDQCETLEENNAISGVEVQTGRSSKIFVIPRSPLSICILSAELGLCMHWSLLFSHLCAGGKCRSSGWCQVPVLVEDGPTVQCNRNLPLRSPESSLEHWSKYLGDLILDTISFQIQVYATA